MKVSRLPFDPGPAAWNSILPAAKGYPALEGNHTADVLIIGAGFAGLSAARRLLEIDPACKVTVLEARRIAEGPAGRNSGFMIDLPHNLGSANYAGTAIQDQIQTAMNREAISFAAKARSDYHMPDEAFEPSGKVNAAATPKGLDHNRAYARHLEALGEPCELLDAKTMQGICGSPYYLGGLYTPGTALIQPALYIRNLAAGVSRDGASVFEHSPVIELNKENKSWRATTPSGAISAAKVILAVNGHAESFGLFRRRLMHIYLYASMTRPLTGEELSSVGGKARWAFTPADPMGTTVRKISGTGGDRIVVRNSFTWAPGRTVDAETEQKHASAHDRSFKSRFPALKHVEMQYRWGGLLCLSRNAVPAFGEQQPGLVTACCQNGLGTAMGTLSGKLAADLACGVKSQHLDSMLGFAAPKKLPPEPFASIGANAVMHWSQFRAGREK